MPQTENDNDLKNSNNTNGKKDKNPEVQDISSKEGNEAIESDGQLLRPQMKRERSKSIDKFLQMIEEEKQNFARTKKELKQNKKKNIRSLVSLNKRRLIEDGFDLDLSYITDRIIAMGFPSSGNQAIYRNPLKQIKKFLESRHSGHYKVYNLCSERDYDITKFDNNVAKFPFDDHNCPSLELLVKFCKDVNTWLDEDEENVAAIHCKAGKGRTGLVICALMADRYKEYDITAKESMDFYAERRTTDHKGVTIASQKRYVIYYGDTVVPRGIPRPKVLKLERIQLNSCPTFEKASCTPWYTISTWVGESQEEIYSSKAAEKLIKRTYGEKALDFFPVGLTLEGDCKITFLHHNGKEDKGMFYFWFHSGFVPPSCHLKFNLNELDGKAKSDQKKNKYFPPAFSVELFFEPTEEEDINSLTEYQKEEKKNEENNETS